MTYLDLRESRLDGVLLLHRDVELVEQDLARVFQSAELEVVAIVVVLNNFGNFLLLNSHFGFDAAAGGFCQDWRLGLAIGSAHHLDSIVIFFFHLSLVSLDIF